MARLHYLRIGHTELLRRVAAELFPSSLAFVIAGDGGQGRLESALAVPRQPNHRTLPDKAAALHYHLNRNHPFIDGNKRFAVSAMEVFIALNGAALVTTDDMLEGVSLSVARDEMSREELALFTRNRTVRFQWTKSRRDRWLQGLSVSDESDVLAALDAYGEEGESTPLLHRVVDALVRHAPGQL